MEIVLLWIALAVVSGIVASAKGRSGFGYFILGLILPIIGLLLAACLPSLKPVAVAVPPVAKVIDRPDDVKKCPMCAETIKREAVKCRYCGSDLAAGAVR